MTEGMPACMIYWMDGSCSPTNTCRCKCIVNRMCMPADSQRLWLLLNPAVYREPVKRVHYTGFKNYKIREIGGGARTVKKNKKFG